MSRPVKAMDSTAPWASRRTVADHCTIRRLPSLATTDSRRRWDSRRRQRSSNSPGPRALCSGGSGTPRGSGPGFRRPVAGNVLAAWIETHHAAFRIHDRQQPAARLQYPGDEIRLFAQVPPGSLQVEKARLQSFVRLTLTSGLSDEIQRTTWDKWASTFSGPWKSPEFGRHNSDAAFAINAANRSGKHRSQDDSLSRRQGSGGEEGTPLVPLATARTRSSLRPGT